MPEGILYALKMLIVVALVFLGLCAVAVALLIIGAVVIAIRTSRKTNRMTQKEQKGKDDVSCVWDEASGVQPGLSADGRTGEAHRRQGEQVPRPAGLQEEADRGREEGV